MALAETELICFTAFGVAVEVQAPAALEAPILALLPPSARRDRGAARVVSVAIDARDGQLVVTAQGETVGATDDECLALGMLDAQIRALVALRAPEHIFVHAGVVAVDDRAILVPGFTFTGKTTLVRALVEAGATYYSDEFAVVDGDGFVHPYAKPLSIRHHGGGGRTTETPAGALGAATGSRPVPAGLIAVTAYKPGAKLEPEPLSSGSALLALLGHTIPARTRPRQSLGALKNLVQGAAAWKSERGEAAEAARAIIAGYRGATSSA